LVFEGIFVSGPPREASRAEVFFPDSVLGTIQGIPSPTFIFFFAPISTGPGLTTVGAPPIAPGKGVGSARGAPLPHLVFLKKPFVTSTEEKTGLNGAAVVISSLAFWLVGLPPGQAEGEFGDPNPLRSGFFFFAAGLAGRACC